MKVTTEGEVYRAGSRTSSVILPCKLTNLHQLFTLLSGWNLKLQTVNILVINKLTQFLALPILYKINVEIPANVTDEVLEKVVQTKQFAYQLNENTYNGNEAGLVAFMRVSDDVEVLERIFFCKFLKGKAKYTNSKFRRLVAAASKGELQYLFVCF